MVKVLGDLWLVEHVQIFIICDELVFMESLRGALTMGVVMLSSLKSNSRTEKSFGKAFRLKSFNKFSNI